jgi:hypothetical protein
MADSPNIGNAVGGLVGVGFALGGLMIMDKWLKGIDKEYRCKQCGRTINENTYYTLRGMCNDCKRSKKDEVKLTAKPIPKQKDFWEDTFG